MNINDNTKGALLAFSGGVMWGLSGACGQYLFENKGATPNWLVPIRLTVAGIIMMIILALKHKTKIFDIWKNKKDAFSILIFAVFGMMMCQYTYFTTISYSNAGTATVLQYLGPAMIMFLICITEKRFPKPFELIAVFCALFGTFLLATHGKIGQMVINKQTLIWGLLAAVTLVIYTVQPGRLTIKYGTMMVMGWGMLLGGLPLCLIFKPWEVPVVFDFATLSALFAVVVIGAVISFNFYLEGVKLVGAAKGSLYACIEPVSATLFSVLWLKTEFQAIDLIGFAFIISTIIILSMTKNNN